LLTGYRPVTHDPRVLDVLEGPELRRLFSRLFGQLEKQHPANGRMPSDGEWAAGPSTFNSKWCRVQSRGESTEEHTDYYRFEHFATSTGASDEGGSGDAAVDDSSRSTEPNLFTCWMPLGCLGVEHGTLTVAEGSHRLSGYRAGVYGSAECKSDNELPPDWPHWRDGDASADVSAGVWRTTSFLPGDVVVFDVRLVHASTRNETPHYRISMDTRWKPTSAVRDDMREAFKPL